MIYESPNYVYTENSAIFELKRMLDSNGIPYDYYDSRDVKFGGICPKIQISYPNNGNNRVCSVIQGYGTYGSEENNLEIMGLIDPERDESNPDSVKGWLSAEEVFNRISKHWQKMLSVFDVR